jgi:hypothetical protein
MADKQLTPLDLPELSSAPASPGSGFHRFYAKTDGKSYSKNSAGTEYDLTASGGSTLTVEAKNSGYTILTTDNGKVFTCDSASAQTFNLPSVDSSNIGTTYTIVKLGTGQVTIDAADSDTIEDSGAGDTVYCADEGDALISLMLTTETQWVIRFANGTWTTTD